jgi:hypothetical protein
VEPSNTMVAEANKQGTFEAPLDGMALDEQMFISNYRALENVPRLAINLFLFRGDLTLVQAIYDHIFLGVRRR